MGLVITTEPKRTTREAEIAYALDGDTLTITAPRKGRKPVTERYALARCAGGFVLEKEDHERHYVANRECSCRAFEMNGRCKHRIALVALYREGRVS